jgi:hypothetical protein
MNTLKTPESRIRQKTLKVFRTPIMRPLLRRRLTFGERRHESSHVYQNDSRGIGGRTAPAILV